MTSRPEDGDKPQKSRKTAAREARVAAALRANLRRRKAQERGRDASAVPGTQTTAKPAAADE